VDPKKIRSALQQSFTRRCEGFIAELRRIMTRGDGTLTRFTRAATHNEPPFSVWALLAGEVWETAQCVVVQIEMPGMREEDVDISIRQGRLVIRGEKLRAAEATPRLYHLMERAFGKFERHIHLPHGLDAAKAEVSFRDGIMTAIVPKMEATPPRRRR
jgi:HSP20 family protein